MLSVVWVKSIAFAHTPEARRVLFKSEIFDLVNTNLIWKYLTQQVKENKINSAQIICLFLLFRTEGFPPSEVLLLILIAGALNLALFL